MKTDYEDWYKSEYQPPLIETVMSVLLAIFMTGMLFAVISPIWPNLLAN